MCEQENKRNQNRIEGTQARLRNQSSISRVVSISIVQSESTEFYYDYHHAEVFWRAVSHEFVERGQRRATTIFRCNNDDKNNKVVSSAITDHLLQHIYWMFIWFRVSLEFPLSFLIFSFTLFHRNAFSISSDVDASTLGSGRRSRTLHACTRYLRTHNLCIGNYHNNKP